MVSTKAHKRRLRAILENGQSYTGYSKITPRNRSSRAKNRQNAVRRQKHDK